MTKGTVTAVVGKGGTGKTSVAALLVKHLLNQGSIPILAIDADPSQGLGPMLGVEPDDTLGSIREEIRGPQGTVPPGVSKKSILDLRVQSAIAEASGFDLLTMGRPEGPGCYCFVNNLLRGSLDTLVENYPWVVIDCEAGMEHLSRRTAKDVDYLFVVCDASSGAIRTAGKILDLIEELRTAAMHRILVLNKLGEDADRVAASLLKRPGLGKFEVHGRILHDPELEACERLDRPLLGLADDCAAFRSLEEILSRLEG